MKKNTLLRHILSAVLSLALIIYLGYQIYSAHHDIIKTEYALDYTYHQTISFNGFIVREESVLNSDVSGVIGYCQPSGSKVAAGHVVAKVFENNEQASIQTEIDDITEKINSLSGLQTAGTQISADAQVLDMRINQTLNQLLNIADTGTTVGYDVVADDLLQLLNKKQITLGTGGDFNAYLASLNAQKASLEASLQSYSEITTEKSGYFINSGDGCETVLDYDSVESLTLDELNRALASTVQQTGAVGKIVASNEWYLTAAVDQNISQTLKLDDMVEITVPLLSDEVYSCEVVALNVDYAAKKTVLVLKCAQINEKIAAARIVNAQLRVNTYQGLRVNQEAMRVVDGITGVYVVDGISAKFKPVDILFSDTDFAICKYDATNSSNLKQYDEVILGGGDLYDGKVIR